MTEGAFAATGGALSSMASALTTGACACGSEREKGESSERVHARCVFRSGTRAHGYAHSRRAPRRTLTRATPAAPAPRQAAPCAATCRLRRGLAWR
jgi:hypothetical protein